MPDRRTPEYEQVEGRNPVLEALRGPRRVLEVVIARGLDRKGTAGRIIAGCEMAGIPIREVDTAELDGLAETSSPQGFIARVEPYRFSEWRELIPANGDHTPLLVALDGVEDPGNFGSLLRVADAAGADGVIIAKRRSAHVTPAVAKASAGALEYVKISQVANIAATLERFKEAGLWVVGAEMAGGTPYYELDLTLPTVVVLGGEGAGLRRLVKERCDFLASLPMLGEVSSLNVAAAGAVLLYEAVRQRRQKV